MRISSSAMIILPSSWSFASMVLMVQPVETVLAQVKGQIIFLEERRHQIVKGQTVPAAECLYVIHDVQCILILPLPGERYITWSGVRRDEQSSRQSLYHLQGRKIASYVKDVGDSILVQSLLPHQAVCQKDNVVVSADAELSVRMAWQAYDR